MPAQFPEFQEGQPLTASDLQILANNDYYNYVNANNAAKGAIAHTSFWDQQFKYNDYLDYYNSGTSQKFVESKLVTIVSGTTYIYPNRYYLIDILIACISAQTTGAASPTSMCLWLKIRGLPKMLYLPNSRDSGGGYADSLTSASIHYIYKTDDDIPENGKKTTFTVEASTTGTGDFLVSYPAGPDYNYIQEGDVQLTITDIGSTIPEEFS